MQPAASVRGECMKHERPPQDITHEHIRWAMEHDWFDCWDYFSETSDAKVIWVKQNGKRHPWPFSSYEELRRWAGY